MIINSPNRIFEMHFLHVMPATIIHSLAGAHWDTTGHANRQAFKIEDDRAWRRVPHFKGVRRTRVDLLTRGECRDLIKACEPGIRTIVVGILFTGCRIKELLNLRVEDLCRTRMAIFIKRGKFYASRHIALPEEGYRFFKTLSFRKDRQALLFLRPGGKPWTKYYLDKGIKRALARANLPSGLVYHTLRHIPYGFRRVFRQWLLHARWDIRT